MPRIILTAVTIAFFVSQPVLSKELRTISWQTTAPLSGTVGEDGVVVVTNDTGGPTTAALAEIQDPGITAPWYALHGTVRYEGVEGIGFLEMWSVFPDGSMFFSRGLADFGPLRRITGSSKWRDFGLPFSLGDTPKRPEYLTFNLVLPQDGTVYIGSLRLVEYDSEASLHEALADGDPGPGTATRWRPNIASAVLAVGAAAVVVVVLAIAVTIGLALRRRASA